MKKKSLVPWMGHWIFLMSVLPVHAYAMGKAPAVSMGPEWPATSGVTTLQIPLDPSMGEAVLQIGYSMKCGSEPEGQQEIFRGVTGQLNVGSRLVRVNLFEGETLVEVNIAGATSPVLSLEIDPNPICALTNLSAQPKTSDFSSGADATTRIALLNSPYWAIREDQYQNRYTDLPMLMSYRAYPDPKKSSLTDIDYIIYFSDEDSGRKASGKSGDVGDYGRSSDIEWVYRVQFDQSWNAVSRTIQTSFHIGDINFGFGHGQEAFKGKYVGSHPIIYDATLNNVGSDHPKGSEQKAQAVVYGLVPRLRLALTDDIDDALLMAPWTYEVTDDEQVAAGKAPAPVVDHLFVMIEGELDGVGPFGWATGKFAAVITAATDGTTTSYQSESTGISRAKIMGDSWLRDSLLTGVLIPENEVQTIAEGKASGTLGFKKESFIRPDLDVKKIRVFRILQDTSGELQTQELSDLFDCRYDGVNSLCTFGTKLRL